MHGKLWQLADISLFNDYAAAITLRILPIRHIVGERTWGPKEPLTDTDQVQKAHMIKKLWDNRPDL